MGTRLPSPGGLTPGLGHPGAVRTPDPGKVSGGGFWCVPEQTPLGDLFSPTSGPPPLEEPGSPKLPLCALSGWAVCASLGHPQVVPSQHLGTAQPPAWRKASRCPFQPRATDTNTQHPSPKVFSKALSPVPRLAPESPGTTQHPLFTPPRF